MRCVCSVVAVEHECLHAVVDIACPKKGCTYVAPAPYQARVASAVSAPFRARPYVAHALRLLRPG
jgi:hypothetical protein